MTIKKWLVFVIWLELGLFPLFFLGTIGDVMIAYRWGTMYWGGMIIIHGLWNFYRHGNSVITPSGLYLLFSTLIMGFPSIYINFISEYEVTLGHYIGSLISYFFQIILFSFWSVKSHFSEFNGDIKRLDIRINIAALTAVLLFLVFVVSRVHPLLLFLFDQSLYILIILYAMVIVISKRHVKIFQLILVFSLFFLYFIFLFENFGRINLVTLLLCIIMTVTLKPSFINFKFLISLFYLPAIFVGASLRSGDITDLGAGIGSIVSPFYRFGQLIDYYNHGMLDLRYGETLFAALVVFVPRVLWEGKPWNFNREITYIFAPQYVEYGHSEAAVVFAELLFNFGYIGILVSLPLMGWLLRKLDLSLLSLLNKKYWNANSIYKLIIIVLISAGMLNLLWGGLSTLINRDGFRMLILLCSLILLKTLPKRWSFKRTDKPRYLYKNDVL